MPLFIPLGFEDCADGPEEVAAHLADIALLAEGYTEELRPYIDTRTRAFFLKLVKE